MKKFFTYSNENIDGGTYFLRQILNSFLIIFFGLGLYLLALTTYKRTKAFDMSDSNAMLCAIVFPILVCTALYFPLAHLLFAVAHLTLIFKNGNKFPDSKKQEILGTINQVPVEELILLVDQNHISLDEMITSGLNHSKQEEIIKAKNINLFPVDTDSHPSEDWVCEKCNEKIGGNFDSCWNCSSNEK